MNKLLPLLFLALGTASINSTAKPLWLRHPAISPDGKTIAFCYKGDIYLVNREGGTAIPLTLHQAHDMMPVWSPDGKTIAFASDRHGNFDVFTIPTSGGTPLRLTHHSANDYPYDFSADGAAVIFSSSRTAQAENIRFHSPGLFQNLYKTPVDGGRPVLLSEAGMEYAHFNKKGTQILFQDRKGYENALRKHHKSAVTRDIWLFEVASEKYTLLTEDNVEDREPVWAGGDDAVYYLSERN